MHFPAIATGFRLLAKCFVKYPVSSSSVGTLPAVASTASIVDAVLKSVEVVEGVTKSIEKQASGDSAKKVVEQDVVESTRNRRVTTSEISQPRADSSKVQVECAQKGGVLQARVEKDLELVAAKRPILGHMAQRSEPSEADELMDKVMEMFEEIHEMERFRLQLRVPAFNDDLGDGVQVEGNRVSLDTWIDPVKEAEIALDVARCEMTVEDVDDLLTRLYIKMNHLVVKHAKDKEERKRLALEVSAKIKEYAEVLLESECEIRLAVERARVRSVVAKRLGPSDAEYLASLAPGSTHVLNCDGSCLSSYLPHRVEEESEVGQVPELMKSEWSRCSTPSEAPSTPRTPNAELQDNPDIMAITEGEKSVDVVLATSEKSPNMAAKTMPARRATKVVGCGKPAWRC